MPYGLSKKHQSKKNEEKMEKCVKAVMREQGYDKESAIKVCKAQYGFTKK